MYPVDTLRGAVNEIMISLVSAVFAEILHRGFELMATKKRSSNQMNVRIEPALREQFDAACAATDRDASDVIRACINAYIAAEARDKEVPTPFAIISKKRLEKLQADFSEAGESDCARVVGSSSGSTARQAHAMEGGHMLNEEPPTERSIKPKLAGPRARSTRGIHNVVASGKSK